MFTGDTVRVTSGKYFGTKGTIQNISLERFPNALDPTFTNARVMVTFSTKTGESLTLDAFKLSKVWHT